LPFSFSILNDSHREQTQTAFERFENESVVPRLKALCQQAREHGLDSLDPARDALIGLGMEVSPDRKVTKNSLGVFDLSWQAEKHPEWPQQIADEVQAIRDRVQSTHNTPIRFLIWAGMGGSIEDKILYHAAGLLRGGPVFYALDSTDPAKLKAILQDMQTRSGYAMPEILRSTLVFGMALGMTSYEPVVNLEKIAALFEQHEVPSAANICYLTLEGSLLDDFGKARGLTRIPLQLDNARQPISIGVRKRRPECLDQWNISFGIGTGGSVQAGFVPASGRSGRARPGDAVTAPILASRGTVEQTGPGRKFGQERSPWP
jgi:hypothetical protein